MAQILTWGGDWADVQATITAKQAKANDYEKAGSVIEGGLGWMLFENIDASIVTGATNNDGLFKFRTTALSKGDTQNAISQVITMVNGYAAYNAANPTHDLQWYYQCIFKWRYRS